LRRIQTFLQEKNTAKKDSSRFNFGLLSLDEQNHKDIQSIPAACSSPVARIDAETGSCTGLEISAISYDGRCSNSKLAWPFLNNERTMYDTTHQIPSTSELKWTAVAATVLSSIDLEQRRRVALCRYYPTVAGSATSDPALQWQSITWRPTATGTYAGDRRHHASLEGRGSETLSQKNSDALKV
jgi:hypothetical protein